MTFKKFKVSFEFKVPEESYDEVIKTFEKQIFNTSDYVGIATICRRQLREFFHSYGEPMTKIVAGGMLTAPAEEE